MKEVKMDQSSKCVPLPNVNGYNCFACGSENPIGLHMKFNLEDDTVISDLVLGRNFAGWESIVHGGIISTLLDEVVGWTVIALKRKFFVTRKLDVRYLRPVPIDERITVQGKIRSESDNGRAVVDAILLGHDGRKSAKAKAEVAFLSDKRIKDIPQNHQDDMNRLFARMKTIVEKNR